MSIEAIAFLAISALTAAGAALLHARIWPLKPCPKCRARGETSPNQGRSLRVCPRCDGSRRVRRLLAPTGN